MSIIDKNASPSEDRIGDALAALKSGKEVEDIHDTGSVVTEEDLANSVIEGSAVDSLFGEDNQETSEGEGLEDSQPSEDGAETATAKDVEDIVVRGPDGKRKKITVDYSNRDQILKNARLAAGARKWQVERDQARANLDKVKDYEEKASNFDKISEAYEAEGELGALKAMIGETNTQEWLENQIQLQEFRRNASEGELKQLEAQERSEKQNRELEKLRREQEELREQMSARQEAAELAELQSVVNPAFDKYRFAGKIEDASQAQDLDEMVWARGKAQLAKYEDQGLSVTPEIADKVFRSVSNRLRKIVNVESDKRADRKVRKVKENALESVQKKTQRGMARNDDNEAAKDLIKKGDYSGFFKSFGRNVKF